MQTIYQNGFYYDIPDSINTKTSPLGWLSGALGLGNTLYNLFTNKRDFDYQKQLQKEIFEREDTAIQRRVEDLKAAGFNPALAMGQAAQAGSVVSRSQTNDVNMGSMLDTISAAQQIKQQKIETQNAAITHDILDYEREKNRLGAIQALDDTRMKGFERQFEADWFNFIYDPENLLKNNPRVYKYMEYQYNNIKNESEILDKQNSWYNANQIIDAVTGGVGALTGVVNAGASLKRASSLYKRSH